VVKITDMGLSKLVDLGTVLRSVTYLLFFLHIFIPKNNVNDKENSTGTPVCMKYLETELLQSPANVTAESPGGLFFCGLIDVENVRDLNFEALHSIHYLHNLASP
jgi:hypothetical protein